MANINGKRVELQLVIQAALVGASELTEAEKAEYLEHALSLALGGSVQVSNLRQSQSGGLAATFMVKTSGTIAPRKAAAAKGAGKGAQKAKAAANLRSVFTADEAAV